jgi:hypothetical protein
VLIVTTKTMKIVMNVLITIRIIMIVTIFPQLYFVVLYSVLDSVDCKTHLRLINRFSEKGHYRL